ncbi:MAG: dihydroorotate dehydrogenase-like protein [Proteobacteria bacterium]|nr:dihydroorotate dehydrogenase-like protein [Pseudomonadota bacterium]
MDLSTNYLGLTLPHPLMPGASPLAEDLDTVRRLEDAGAAAIILHSLFEEQILSEHFREIQDVEAPEETFPEALTYHPHRGEYVATGPDKYLERVRKTKETVSVPVLASLNGISTSAWIEYATKCEQAGADALELNVYFLATNPKESGEAVEKRVVDVVQAVRGAVKIPIAVKLSPFFSSLPHLAQQLEKAGADGMVLFNRFYQPDIDVEDLEVVPKLLLSNSSELLLRLHWLAILSGRVGFSLGATGGVHTALDVVKAVMAGAHGVQMVSTLLKNGPDHLRKILDGVTLWMDEHEYESIDQMRGNMSLLKSPDPAAFERVNYMRILQGGTKYV